MTYTKRFIPVLILTVLLAPNAIFAQEDFSEEIPIGDVFQCTDYFESGSVGVNMEADIDVTIPGSTITLEGEIRNNNDFPVADGSVFVKIFRSASDDALAGNIDVVVDQFLVVEDVILPANATESLSYEWPIPSNAQAGSYYASHYFVAHNQIQYLGNTDIDGLLGSITTFSIASTESMAAPIELQKQQTTLNGETYSFTAVPVVTNDVVEVSTEVTNTTDEQKTLTLQWVQYADGLLHSNNVKNTDTQLVILEPNETRTISYEVVEQREANVHVTATMQDLGSKSILNVGYVQGNNVDPTIDFVGVDRFPLVAGEENVLVACLHSADDTLIENTTVLIRLNDQSGTKFHEFVYEGGISGVGATVGERFTTDRTISSGSIVTTIIHDGKIANQLEIIYDCNELDPNSCVSEERVPVVTGDHKSIFLPVSIGGVMILILLLGLLVLSRKKVDGSLQEENQEEGDLKESEEKEKYDIS